MQEAGPTRPRRRRPFAAVEVVPEEPPYSSATMERLGLRGIHCGSARQFKPGWLNTDRMRLRDKDGRRSEPSRIVEVLGNNGVTSYYMQYDSREPYPFEPETFEWAFAEHFIEHLTLDETVGWLKEVHRILKPGGLVRLTTPSLAKYVEGYQDPEGRFFAEHRERLARLPNFQDGEVPSRRAWMLNQIFMFWTHAWIYDADEVRHVAVQAGFPADGVEERAYRDSAVEEVAALDLPMRSDESLYVELRRD
jgi:predicted SAM-dependent methyltransferase